MAHRYYCEYCDIFLKHDSQAARKAHDRGLKHRANKQGYYSKFLSAPSAPGMGPSMNPSMNPPSLATGPPAPFPAGPGAPFGGMPPPSMPGAPQPPPSFAGFPPRQPGFVPHQMYPGGGPGGGWPPPGAPGMPQQSRQS